MKFHLAVNLERMNDATDMMAVQKHTLEMVQMADRAGFEIAWAAEHHALEMTIAPNPFQLLTWWADHTDSIRLGSGVANAAYWHPINIAGEAAMVDLISGGRLEFGLGSGPISANLTGCAPGLDQKDSYRYMQEMLPLVRQLWQGDVTHEGEFWQFPAATSCPKPVQEEVPFWVAARSPITFDYAVANDCNIMSWPLTLPMSEAQTYRRNLDEAIAKANNGWAGTFAVMRHTAVYANAADRSAAIAAIRNVLAQFGNLMMNGAGLITDLPNRSPLLRLRAMSGLIPTCWRKI